jgi:hypothetical protein
MTRIERTKSAAPHLSTFTQLKLMQQAANERKMADKRYRLTGGQR